MTLKLRLCRHLSGLRTGFRRRAVLFYIKNFNKLGGATLQKRLMHSVNLKRKFSVGVPPLHRNLEQGLFNKRLHYTKPAAVGISMKKIKDHHMVEIRNKHTKELVDLEVGYIITKTRLFKYTEKFTAKKWQFFRKKILIFFICLLKT